MKDESPGVSCKLYFALFCLTNSGISGLQIGLSQSRYNVHQFLQCYTVFLQFCHPYRPSFWQQPFVLHGHTKANTTASTTSWVEATAKAATLLPSKRPLHLHLSFRHSCCHPSSHHAGSLVFATECNPELLKYWGATFGVGVWTD